MRPRWRGVRLEREPSGERTHARRRPTHPRVGARSSLEREPFRRANTRAPPSDPSARVGARSSLEREPFRRANTESGIAERGGDIDAGAGPIARSVRLSALRSGSLLGATARPGRSAKREGWQPDQPDASIRAWHFVSGSPRVAKVRLKGSICTRRFSGGVSLHRAPLERPDSPVVLVEPVAVARERLGEDSDV